MHSKNIITHNGEWQKILFNLTCIMCIEVHLLCHSQLFMCCYFVMIKSRSESDGSFFCNWLCYESNRKLYCYKHCDIGKYCIVVHRIGTIQLNHLKLVIYIPAQLHLLKWLWLNCHIIVMLTLLKYVFITIIDWYITDCMSTYNPAWSQRKLWFLLCGPQQ